MVGRATEECLWVCFSEGGEDNTAIMEAIRTWFCTPVRELRRFFRALDLTSRATCDADAFLMMMESDWVGTGERQADAAYDASRQQMRERPVELPSTSFAVLVSGEEEPGEIAPDFPEQPLSIGTSPASRRGAAFRRYWVARLHEAYPRVVGSWDESSLACSRMYLCKAMREPRKYFVEDKIGQNVTLRARFKRGMTTQQIASCVDWIVTAGHLGTPEQAAQRAIRESLKPNWLMRMFGVRTSVAGW